MSLAIATAFAFIVAFLSVIPAGRGPQRARSLLAGVEANLLLSLPLPLSLSLLLLLSLLLSLFFFLPLLLLVSRRHPEA